MGQTIYSVLKYNTTSIFKNCGEEKGNLSMDTVGFAADKTDHHSGKYRISLFTIYYLLECDSVNTVEDG
jgi:hypothetical protein